jgi:hypothetical protein
MMLKKANNLRHPPMMDRLNPRRRRRRRSL